MLLGLIFLVIFQERILILLGDIEPRPYCKQQHALSYPNTSTWGADG